MTKPKFLCNSLLRIEPLNELLLCGSYEHPRIRLHQLGMEPRNPSICCLKKTTMEIWSKTDKTLQFLYQYAQQWPLDEAIPLKPNSLGLPPIYKAVTLKIAHSPMPKLWNLQEPSPSFQSSRTSINFIKMPSQEELIFTNEVLYILPIRSNSSIKHLMI